MTLARGRLDSFRKKTCSFCKKITYDNSTKLIFNKKEIEITFCKKCNNKSEEEKAIVIISQIIKLNPEKTLEDVLDIVNTDSSPLPKD
jgi:hypothetical protein